MQKKSVALKTPRKRENVDSKVPIARNVGDAKSERNI